MGTVQKLAETVREGLQAAHPKRRKTIIHKLALAVGAMTGAQTPNTSELASILPVSTERPWWRQQALRNLVNLTLQPQFPSLCCFKLCSHVGNLILQCSILSSSAAILS